jgi:hypothetical protein
MYPALFLYAARRRLRSMAIAAQLSWICIGVAAERMTFVA